MVNNISIENLLSKSNINIIDIRSVEQFNSNHIPRAINIPFEKIIIDPSKYINHNETYYFYCKYGKKSMTLCIYLSKLGYKVVNIQGGYENWLLKK